MVTVIDGAMNMASTKRSERSWRRIVAIARHLGASGAAAPQMMPKKSPTVAKQAAGFRAVGESLRTQFHHDGFCVVPGILSNEEIERAKRQGEAEAEAMTPEEKETHKNTGSLLPTISPAFAPLIANKNLMAAFEGMGFTDSMSGNTKWSCGFVISKPPRSPSLPWHQDCVVWDHDIAYESRPHQVFAFYYLTDTTLTNGCLRAIPGTHLRRHPLHDMLAAEGEAHSDTMRKKSGDGGDARAHLEAAIERDAVDVCVKAGDVVVGDARLLHATRANASDARRTLVTLWFHPHYAQLPDRVANDMIALSHQKYSSPIYAGWPEALLAATRAMLPDMKGHKVLSAAQARAQQDDHSLETYVRTPSLDRLV